MLALAADRRPDRRRPASRCPSPTCADRRVVAVVGGVDRHAHVRAIPPGVALLCRRDRRRHVRPPGRRRGTSSTHRSARRRVALARAVGGNSNRIRTLPLLPASRRVVDDGVVDLDALTALGAGHELRVHPHVVDVDVVLLGAALSKVSTPRRIERLAGRHVDRPRSTTSPDPPRSSSAGSGRPRRWSRCSAMPGSRGHPRRRCRRSRRGRGTAAVGWCGRGRSTALSVRLTSPVATAHRPRRSTGEAPADQVERHDHGHLEDDRPPAGHDARRRAPTSTRPGASASRAPGRRRCRCWSPGPRPSRARWGRGRRTSA